MWPEVIPVTNEPSHTDYYLGRPLSRSWGLGDLDVLYLNGVLAVAMRVLELAYIYCLMLRMWRGSLWSIKNNCMLSCVRPPYYFKKEILAKFLTLTVCATLNCCGHIIIIRSWFLPEPPAPLVAECVVAETSCLLPERQECTGSSGSLPAVFGSLWSVSETAPSSPELADLWSVKKANHRYAIWFAFDDIFIPLSRVHLFEIPFSFFNLLELSSFSSHAKSFSIGVVFAHIHKFPTEHYVTRISNIASPDP